MPSKEVRQRKRDWAIHLRKQAAGDSVAQAKLKRREEEKILRRAVLPWLREVVGESNKVPLGGADPRPKGYSIETPPNRAGNIRIVRVPFEGKVRQ